MQRRYAPNGVRDASLCSTLLAGRASAIRRPLDRRVEQLARSDLYFGRPRFGGAIDDPASTYGHSGSEMNPFIAKPLKETGLLVFGATASAALLQLPSA